MIRSQTNALKDIEVELDELNDEARSIRQTIEELEGDLAYIGENADYHIAQADQIMNDADETVRMEIREAYDHLREIVDAIKGA